MKSATMPQSTRNLPLHSAPELIAHRCPRRLSPLRWLAIVLLVCAVGSALAGCVGPGLEPPNKALGGRSAFQDAGVPSSIATGSSGAGGAAGQGTAATGVSDAGTAKHSEDAGLASDAGVDDSGATR